ncbi:MAG: substrate-binding domain-containing protein [Bryobacteraceae bacterium]
MRSSNAALALIAIALAACGGARNKQVAVIPKATSHVFWLTVQAGAVAAGQEFGLDIVWNGPTQETDFTRQIQIVDSMIARRMDGIVLAAADRKALVAPVDRAMAAGIPVTVFDSGLDSDNYMSYVATDNVEAGRIAGRALGAILGGKGKAAVVMHVPGSVSTMDREQGFDEVMAKDFPGIQVVQKLYGMSDRSKAMAAAENILTAHPDLDAFFASTEPSTTGAILALKSRGLSGKVKLVGFDSNDAMLDALRDGTLTAMVIQDPFKIGYEAVRTIADKLAGKTPPKRQDLQGILVTKENVEKPEIIELIKPDLKKYLE